MSEIDFTTKLGAARLEEHIETQMRILSGQRMKAFGNLYNTMANFKGKKKGQLHVGSLDMSKQTDSKGKVNQTHIDAKKVYLELCDYDVEVCFDFDELNSLEADIMGPTITRMREASDKVCDLAFLDALFGDIMMGGPCEMVLHKNLCHIEHDGIGMTPQKVIAALSQVAAWHPGSEVCVGITNETMFGMTEYPEWTNNDFLVTGSAYSGMIQKWGKANFKLTPDFRNMSDMDDDPFGYLEPIIPAVPYIVGGIWDGESFVRFLPVWVKNGMDHAHGYGPMITAMPDAWKYRSLAYGVGLVRIDERLGFNANDERARAVICVVEKSKALAEAYVKQGGVGFGAPEGIAVV